MVVRHPLITFTPFLFNNKVYQPAKHPASYQKGDSSNDQTQQCWPKGNTFPTLRQYFCGRHKGNTWHGCSCNTQKHCNPLGNALALIFLVLFHNCYLYNILFIIPSGFTILTTDQYCIVNSSYTPCNGPKGDYQPP